MTNKELKNLRVFGYGLSVILTFLSWRNLAHEGSITLSIGLVIGALFFVIITAIMSPVLKIIYDKWMIVAHMIGNIISSAILIIFFYVVFGTIGIILRIIRKDFLDRQLDPHAESYWHIREDTPFYKNDCLKQF